MFLDFCIICLPLIICILLLKTDLRGWRIYLTLPVIFFLTIGVTLLFYSFVFVGPEKLANDPVSFGEFLKFKSKIITISALAIIVIVTSVKIWLGKGTSKPTYLSNDRRP